MGSKAAKVLEAGRRNPSGVRFSDLLVLVEAAGFVFKRQKGSHRVYGRAGVPEILTLQSDGANAKPYQVRQVLELIEKYNLEVE